MTRTAGAQIGCQRPSRFWGLGCPKIYHEAEDTLGVRAIHAKIRNRRKDAIHKFTTHLAERYGVIFVGDVSSAKLVKTKMAKSVLDAGWHQLKTQLKYKAIARSGVFEEVNEAYSTQVCSCCGAKPDSSPKGRAGLGIRHWICSECGAEHDRDINAALNILAAGGIPVSMEESSPFRASEDVKARKDGNPCLHHQ